jgi:hypothetical protein
LSLSPRTPGRSPVVTKGATAAATDEEEVVEHDAFGG